MSSILPVDYYDSKKLSLSVHLEHVHKKMPKKVKTTTTNQICNNSTLPASIFLQGSQQLFLTRKLCENSSILVEGNECSAIFFQTPTLENRRDNFHFLLLTQNFLLEAPHCSLYFTSYSDFCRIFVYRLVSFTRF